MLREPAAVVKGSEIVPDDLRIRYMDSRYKYNCTDRFRRRGKKGGGGGVVGKNVHLIVRGASFSSDRKLSATLPQLSFLVHLRFIHILPSDLPTNKMNQIRPHGGDKTRVYLLNLSDYLVGHVRVSFREVITSIDGDSSLVSGFYVQRSFREEGDLAKRVIVFRDPLTGAHDT